MEFKLPDIGEGVHEGEIVKWLVAEGDNLAVDQPMVEIMTDKATVEIPSPISGTIEKLHAKPGDVVKVGQVILSLAGGAGAAPEASASRRPDTSITAAAPAAKAAPAAAPAPTRAAPQASSSPAQSSGVAQTAARAASAPQPQRPMAQPVRATAPMAPQRAVPSAPSPTGQSTNRAPAPELGGASSHLASPGNVLATPATRRLARDLGVDLTQVEATGPNGRVTKEDVQQFGGASAAGPQLPVQRPASMAPGRSGQTAPMGAPAARTPLPSREISAEQTETLIPFRGIRRKIAEAMSRSRTTIPEFTYIDECDVTELVAFRKEVKATAEKQGVKITYLPFIIKAMVRALRDYPQLNSSLDEQGGNIIQKNYYNFGIAVDTDEGLVVPVVKNADRKSILEIAAEITELAEKARTRKLSSADMQGATITITNPGPIGGLITAPVINWPEVAIMGVHKIMRRPVVKTGADGEERIVAADMIYLSLAVDHRVVDGATAARFMNVVLEYLGSPKKLMLEMA